MSDKLISARSKIKRAKKHIVDLESAVSDFRASNPYEIGAKRDSQTRRLVYYMSKVDPIPEEMPQIIGEAIQCLRSALDQLAYQLWLTGTKAGRERSVYFPIFPAKEPKSEFERKIKGASQPIIDALESIEPYQGGKSHQLWVLNELNNTDKHRTIVTVGGAYQAFDFGAHITSLAASQFPHLEIPIVSGFLNYGCRICPLELGTELIQDAPDAEPNKHLKFVFDVAIHEPGIIESESAVPFLNQLTQFTEGTLAVFECFL